MKVVEGIKKVVKITYLVIFHVFIGGYAMLSLISLVLLPMNSDGLLIKFHVVMFSLFIFMSIIVLYINYLCTKKQQQKAEKLFKVVFFPFGIKEPKFLAICMTFILIGSFLPAILKIISLIASDIGF
ncbi:hypothetical protein [Calidifontibacillus erzurumensis]|uniref:hypothetical protein n=1 Tax=Calidifontibacillus erzurumensis TaxID=2741433 RepID=UPI0035B521C5